MFPFLGFGLGLRNKHFKEILATTPKVDWFEAITENYLGLSDTSASDSIEELLKIRQNYPICLHGVSLSIGSADALNANYLKKWKSLIDIIEPEWVSDHLCWTGVLTKNSHDLLPLPYTKEAIANTVTKIKQVQDFLGRRILMENVSSYVEASFSEMNEAEFLAEVCNQADCGILLDLNNIFVSSYNHGFDPETYLDKIPWQRVGQVHLAGPTDKGSHMIDTHDQPVREETWKLYQSMLRRYKPITTMIEWDDKIPPLTELIGHLDVARRFVNQGVVLAP
ncbi:MAG: DUF692 domain-containing protein [Bdellovibrionales bacterium]|nr:DUF692 domain-containing protein [Bdellovibrionales bacterium]